jgi:hypothetical protein
MGTGRRPLRKQADPWVRRRLLGTGEPRFGQSACASNPSGSTETSLSPTRLAQQHLNRPLALVVGALTEVVLADSASASAM